MRQFALAAAAVCATAVLTEWAGAQVANTMPGQLVGSGYSGGTVGTPIPKAAPPAGQPINLPAETAMMRRYDPNRPYDVFKGTNLSPNLLAAPVAPPVGDQTIFDKFKAFFGIGQQPASMMPSHSTYFPSLTRRNRERAEERLWRRD